MTTMPIDNHPLPYRRLQFVGISVNKLTLKSINIIQSSNNYIIVSSFICWNQNIVHMKILDTSFKMTKRRFRVSGQKMCITRVKFKKLKAPLFTGLRGRGIQKTGAECLL